MIIGDRCIRFENSYSDLTVGSSGKTLNKWILFRVRSKFKSWYGRRDLSLYWVAIQEITIMIKWTMYFELIATILDSTSFSQAWKEQKRCNIWHHQWVMVNTTKETWHNLLQHLIRTYNGVTLYFTARRKSGPHLLWFPQNNPDRTIDHSKKTCRASVWQAPETAWKVQFTRS